MENHERIIQVYNHETLPPMARQLGLSVLVAGLYARGGFGAERFALCVGVLRHMGSSLPK